VSKFDINMIFVDERVQIVVVLDGVWWQDIRVTRMHVYAKS